MIRISINKILMSSPYLELLVRRFYYRFKIGRKINAARFQSKPNSFTELRKIFQLLLKEGFKKDEILILHSSFAQIQNIKLTPREIINEFLSFLNDGGTLAMNAARKLKLDSNNFLVYDKRKSRVWTGVLPAEMLKFKEVHISDFPINSMVAIGKDAKTMMLNNLSVDSTSCGVGSSWAYCYDKNAMILGLGIDLVHSLTMIHVAEEYSKKWPINDWFERKKYKIIKDNQSLEYSLKVRKEKWGQLYFAERTLRKDLIRSSILKTYTVDGLTIEMIRSKELIDYLNTKNGDGYPYFLTKLP